MGNDYFEFLKGGTRANKDQDHARRIGNLDRLFAEGSTVASAEGGQCSSQGSVVIEVEPKGDLYLTLKAGVRMLVDSG